MNTALICIAAAITALSSLARLNDLPRKGQHALKVALCLCMASSILLAMLTVAKMDIPLWLISAMLIGCAVESVATAPFDWFKWIRHGDRRASCIGAFGHALRRRKTDHV